jgi:hypothetical protein
MVSTTVPTLISSPSSSATSVRTLVRRRNVPFVLPRSSSVTRRVVLSTRMAACRRETPGASSQTLQRGSRPMTFSPSESEDVRPAQATQHEFGLLPVVADGSPDFAHQNVEIGVGNVGIRPDSRVQRLLLDDLRPALDQRAEQVERLRGEMDLCARAQKLAGF